MSNLFSAQKDIAFTIVELLIVIVVIAVLATISIVAYNGIQDRAKVSSVADNLNKIEKALRVQALSSGASSWWTDSSLGCATGDSLSWSRNLSSMSTSCGMSQLSFVKDTTGVSYGYDNDGDTASACSSSTGVGIMLYGPDVNTALFQQLSQLMDNEVTNCGKVSAYDTTHIFYRVAVSSSDL